MLKTEVKKTKVNKEIMLVKSSSLPSFSIRCPALTTCCRKKININRGQHVVNARHLIENEGNEKLLTNKISLLTFV